MANIVPLSTVPHGTTICLFRQVEAKKRLGRHHVTVLLREGATLRVSSNPHRRSIRLHKIDDSTVFFFLPPNTEVIIMTE